MNLLIGRYYATQELASASSKAEQAKSQSDLLRLQVAELQRKTDALTIACQALWEIVSEKTGVDDNAILARMQEIDLRDGRADGKISTTLAQCPSCGRQSNASRMTCLYCGESLPVSPGFAPDSGVS